MKKFMRGVMFPVKKPFSGASAGLSLVEIVISVAVLLMLVVAASRIVQRNARMIDDSRQNTAASAIFQMMENRIKGMPFHDVYWFDSSNKAYIGSYPYLFQPWAINTSSKTLYYMEAEAAKRGFNRIRIESVYMRRDSSDMSNNNRILEDSVEWRDTNNDRCDDLDPSLCFRYCNVDLDYFDMCNVGGKIFPEVPDTGLKKLTIRLYRNNREIASHGFFLIEGGLSGEEMQLTESPLKLEILRPFHSKTYYFFPAKTELIPNLELLTQRNYPAGYYGYGPAVAGTHALRLDNLPVNVSVDRSVVTPGGVLLTGAPDSHLNAIGATEPGARVDFYFRADAGAMPSNTTIPDSSEYADSAGNINVQVQLGGISQKLMVQGRPQFWARAFNRGFYSPFVYRSVCVDATAPQIKDTQPMGEHTAGGFSPFIYMSSEDPWFHGSCANSVSSYLMAAIITDELGRSTATWDGKPTSYRLNSPGRWNTALYPRRYYQYLWNVSDRYLPPQLAPGTYTMAYETGDTAMMKSSTSWTFTLPATISADVTPSTITAPSGFVAGDPANLAYYYATHTTTKSVLLGGALAFGRIRFEDAESGIRMNTIRLDCCDDTLTFCHNIYQYASDGSFGQRFSLGSTSVQLNIYPTHTFAALTGHIAGTHRRIRVTASNWAGIPTVLDDWYIQVN